MFRTLIVAAALIVTASPACAGPHIDHGKFYGSPLSVACFVDRGEYPHDDSTARWACWRTPNLNSVDTRKLSTVYRGKLGGLYGKSWGDREDLTLDGMSKTAKSVRVRYDRTYFCYTGRWSDGSVKASRKHWSCFRDYWKASDQPLVYVDDDLPGKCNDLTTYYVAGRSDNPSGPVASSCR